MSELPNGWSMATLPEIIGSGGLITDGDWVESKDQDPNGEVRLIQLADIGEFRFVDKSNRFLTGDKFLELRCTELQTDDVLIARMPDPLGRACLYPSFSNRAVTVVDVCIWRAGDYGASARWVAAMINSPQTREWIHKHSSGTTRKRISTGNLKKYEFPLPPLAEQKRIVEKLDSLTAESRTATTALSRAKVLLRSLRSSILQEAFSDPRFWEDQVALGDVLNGIKAGKNLRCTERPPEAHEKGVVKVSAVTYGTFDPSQSKTLPSSFEPDPDTLIRSGDFLFSRANTLELVGASTVVSSAPDNLYLSDKILRLEMPEELKSWVDLFLKSPVGRSALEGASSGNQQSMRNISQKALRMISIPMTSMGKRTEIIERVEAALDQIFAMAEIADVNDARLEELKQAILAKAFRGDLVPQDPSDEPASELLKRAQASTEQPILHNKQTQKGAKNVPKASEQLEQLVKSWPDSGLTFEELNTKISGSYDDIRDALFGLLQAPEPLLVQKFDESAQIMRLKRVES